MNAIIFAGPSVHRLELKPQPDVTFRPPARQGDVYRAALLRPRVIGLIDGYFDGVPAVWHKEVLWALSQGIQVYGSASMGALRAAELDAFGMRGIGRIYEWYRDGVLEDDDEVALLHGPEETGFVPLSEPMVNVRATCAAAVEAGLLDRATAGLVIATAKSVHYKDRTWPGVLGAAGATGAAGLDGAIGAKFAGWLATGRIDQKRIDAEELIVAVSAAADQPERAEAPSFRFEWTDLWDRVVEEWTAEARTEAVPGAVFAAEILDELRLEPERFADIRLRALHRAVLLQKARRDRITVGRPERLRQLARLRERLGLMRKTELDAWIARNGLTADEFEALIEEEALIERASQAPAWLIDHHMMSILQLDGGHAALADRAARKRRALQAAGDDVPSSLPLPLLLNWYFTQRRRRPVPDDLDGFLAGLGLSSRQAFYRLLAAEHVYSAEEADVDGG